MNIVLDLGVEKSQDKYDVVVSNVEFIKKAFDNNLIDSDLNPNSIALYYLDYFDEIVAFSGFKAFFFKTRNSAYIKDEVKKALELLKLVKHLEIFNDYLKTIDPINEMDIYQLEGNMKISFYDLDEAYRDLSETLIEQAQADYLLNHPDTIFLSEVDQDKLIQSMVKDISVEEMIKRENEILKKVPSYLRDIQLICNELNKQFEALTDSKIQMFDFDPKVIVYFKTHDEKTYAYIDLGLEVVLCDEHLNEIKRYLKAKLGELNG